MDFTTIKNSSRIGVSNFGGTVSLGSSELRCNGFEIDGEVLAADTLGMVPPIDTAPVFHFTSPNVCGDAQTQVGDVGIDGQPVTLAGCGADIICKVSSSQPQPPELSGGFE